jgi:hypothetical protein
LRIRSLWRPKFNGLKFIPKSLDLNSICRFPPVIAKNTSGPEIDTLSGNGVFG